MRCLAQRGYASAVRLWDWLPRSNLTTRSRPSRSGTTGSQPRSALAFVMSGCRTLGSSIGSAE